MRQDGTAQGQRNLGDPRHLKLTPKAGGRKTPQQAAADSRVSIEQGTGGLAEESAGFSKPDGSCSSAASFLSRLEQVTTL